VGGENGLIYRVDLNSTQDSAGLNPVITPKVLKARYLKDKYQYQGIENSLVGYKDKIYLSDNHGFIQCLNANDLTQVWALRNHDDTDATLILEEESDSIPYLYTGNEVDLQGAKGYVFVKKLNGLNGGTVWEQKFPCLTIRGDHPVNGGMLSTPVLGKNHSDSLVVFCLSRYGALNKGLLVALDKLSGEKVWEAQLDNYAWSSPLDIYDEEGYMYIFLADSRGYVMLFDGATGKLIYKEKIAEIFEASPAAFNNKIIIASRPRKIFCLEVQ
jgi:outer membrane protein assembly factor BamB